MKQVKFVPHQSQWTDEEFQAMVEGVENDIDGELEGAQTTIATKIAEVKEQIAPLKATKATLDLMDTYRLEVKSGIRQLKLKLLNYEAILQKLAEMRRLYQSYLHVRDLPSSSPTKDEFSDIVPILSESQLRCLNCSQHIQNMNVCLNSSAISKNVFWFSCSKLLSEETTNVQKKNKILF
ncbi:hypothetical protein TVAGG3_0024940 [Trichomonas vaginalis G3]|uniref:hypothetical protein n=1 Tax=Trichomonas vaginalis (strain ATCC PRA-98 / G3) TaxID=412133 RepID=UPI0021E5D87C|nr:hypothetical protein TVAGG3_0024940 [Trichomonas vaginalis G3]KAI5539829.1 hypothetical protein TVAGG3_0024940 [Trichomonas vaginalis G3]